MALKMEDIVSLCKRRGFVFQSSEIYGGFASCWDYGPLGVELKRNVKDAWWQSVVRERDDMVGLDSSILMHPKIWEASGHVATFNDPLVDCKNCNGRFRADHVDLSAPCPTCGTVGSFTEPRNFNLMFKTTVGPVDKEDGSNIAYLRPETAQGIFVNFLNAQTTSRKKLPFGIAQIGKAFRHLNVPNTLDKFQIPAYSCKVVAAEAAKYIEAEKPNVCFIHFADSDGAGHAYGWGSPEQVKSFADEDEALKTVREAVKRAGIEKDSVFILSADHGGHAKTHGSNSPEDMTIPWITWGNAVQPGFEIKTPVTTYDTAATALWLLDVPVPAGFDGKPVVDAFKPAPTKNIG